MAETFPLGRALPSLLPLPAYFLVSISPAGNSPKVSSLWRLLISTPTQSFYPNAPRKPRGGSKGGRPPPEAEARGARRPPPASRARAGLGIAARRPPRWDSPARPRSALPAPELRAPPPTCRTWAAARAGVLEA